MNPILILREEIVCLIILIYLAYISRTFRMGKDGKIFNKIMSFAMAHVILDGFTVWSVNHMEQVHTQLERTPRKLPKMVINPDVKNIFDFKYEDFQLEEYDPWPHISGKVSV